jgi:hypothetical protein
MRFRQANRVQRRSCNPFPGLKGLDKPIVWVFPSLRVCIACGLAQFIVPEAELEQLTEYGGPQGMQLVPKEF